MAPASHGEVAWFGMLRVHGILHLVVSFVFQGCQAQLTEGKRAWEMACVSFYEAGVEVHNLWLELSFTPHLTAKEAGKPIST